MSEVGNYSSTTRTGTKFGKFQADSGKGGIQFGMSPAEAAKFAPNPGPAPKTGEVQWTGMRGGIKSKKTGKERTRFQPPRERGSKQYSRRSVAQSNLEYLASLKKGSGGRRTRKHRRNTRRR